MNTASPSPEGGPTVLRILLGTQLRRPREANGVTREVAGEAIRASSAKLSRLELGRVAGTRGVPRPRDPRHRPPLVTAAQRQQHSGSSTAAAAQRQQHSEVLPSWFEMYLRLEQPAKVIAASSCSSRPGCCRPGTTPAR